MSQNGNEAAARLHDEVIESLSLECIDSGERYPGSLKEISDGLSTIRKARDLGPDDPEVLEALRKTEDVLTDARTRQFSGSWLIIGFIGAFVLFMLWVTGIQPLNLKMSTEQATRGLQLTKKQIHDQIERYQTKLDTISVKDTKSKYEEYLTDAQEELKEYTSLTPEQYRSKRKKQSFARGIRGILRQLIWIGLLIGYYYTARAPKFLIMKRMTQMQLMKKSGNLFFKVALGILGVLIAMPAFSETRIHWSDGTRSTETDFTPLLLKLIGIVVVVFMVVYALMVILPWLVIINYLRNYQFERVEALFDSIMAKLRGAAGQPAK